MKKRLSVLLALCLLLSVCAAPVALAAGVTVLSTQNLAVDGKTIPCEKYNIDGSNYFKLRDMAYLLNGTGSQFAVGWDAASSTVSITTGQPYTPNGTELKLDGGDKSATSVPSSQTIKIDGVVVSNLSVYNIGGNNYFKLRDLGTALGFEVGYDAATFTATVTTVKEMVWLPVKATTTYVWTGDDPWSKSYNTEYTYDAKGRIVKESGEADPAWREPYVYTYVYEGTTVSFTETHYYDDGTPWTYATKKWVYDDSGKLFTMEDWIHVGFKDVYYFDEHGNCATSIHSDTYEPAWMEIYTYSNTYDSSGKLLKSVRNNGEMDDEIKTYIYDVKGNLIVKKEESFSSWSEEWSTYIYTYTYDSEGRVITEQQTDGELISYTYDANGNQDKMIRHPDEGFSITTVTEYAQFPKAD